MGGSPLRRPWPRAAPGAQSPRVKTNTREAALWGADATDWGAIQPRAAAGHPEGRGCPRPPRRPCKWAGRWPVPKSSAGGGGHRAPLQKSSPVIQAVQGPHGNGGRPARTDERDHSPGVHPVPHPAPGGGRQEGRGGGWLYLGGLGGQGQGSREASAPRAGVETPRGGSRNGPDWKEGRGQALSAAPSTTPFQARPARPGGARPPGTAESHRRARAASGTGVLRRGAWGRLSRGGLSACTAAHLPLRASPAAPAPLVCPKGTSGRGGRENRTEARGHAWHSGCHQRLAPHRTQPGKAQ